MMTCDAAAEDQGEFVGLTDGAIGIDESLLEGINGGTTTKDEIVGELHLGKKQPVLNTGLLSLLGSEKGCEAGQPFVGADNESANTTQSIPARQNNDQRFVPSDNSIWTGCRLVVVGNVPSFKGQEVQFTSAQVFPDSGELQTSGFRLKTQRRSEASNFDSYRDYAMFALT